MYYEKNKGGNNSNTEITPVNFLKHKTKHYHGKSETVLYCLKMKGTALLRPHLRSLSPFSLVHWVSIQPGKNVSTGK